MFKELDCCPSESADVGDKLSVSSTSSLSSSSMKLRLTKAALSVDDVGRTVSGVNAVVDDLALSAGVIKSLSYSASTA